MTEGRLQGEVAIVTGSTSGLGHEIAVLFAEEGASVVVTGRRSDRGNAVAAEIPGASFVAADLTDAAARSRLVDTTIARHGHVSILVNNAVSPTAIAADGPVTTIDTQLWDATLSVALVAAAELCRLVIPPMIERGGGAIVNVSAKSAQLARPGLAAYSSAKAGLDALSRSITADHARSGVRCNTLQPGYILHDERDADLTPERRAELEARQLTRLATARDVALAALFLASKDAEVITGITLPVDGGSTAVRGTAL